MNSFQVTRLATACERKDRGARNVIGRRLKRVEVMALVEKDLTENPGSHYELRVEPRVDSGV